MQSLYTRGYRAEDAAAKYVSCLKTEFGTIAIRADEDFVLSVRLADPCEEKESGLTKYAASCLLEYLRGERTVFDVPLSPQGTPFQIAVWQRLLQIPFGSVKTYGEIAAETGNKSAARAVGSAAGKNPILIMIPCHRVVAAGGRLGGFSAGLPLKRRLLETEKIDLR